MLASLEKQNFTEAWGKLAKETFPDTLLDTFTDPTLKNLIKKIDVLGPANLPTTERERVRLHAFPKLEINIGPNNTMQVYMLHSA